MDQSWERVMNTPPCFSLGSIHWGGQSWRIMVNTRTQVRLQRHWLRRIRNIHVSVQQKLVHPKMSTFLGKNDKQPVFKIPFLEFNSTNRGVCFTTICAPQIDLKNDPPACRSKFWDDDPYSKHLEVS